MTSFLPLRVRASQGAPTIADVRSARPLGFRGLPVLRDAPCPEGCEACRDACPTTAIALSPLRLDLGRCAFCNECVAACPEDAIAFSPEPKMAATDRARLVLEQGKVPALRPDRSDLARVFGRSLKLRQVSAGGCNACELELGAIANVNFDAQRFGIEWVASPRHADALVISGPLTRNMRDAIRLSWEAMPEPRFVIATGACAISGGLYDGAPGVDRTFFDEVGPALYVPGCPPHPLTIVNAILDFLGHQPK